VHGACVDEPAVVGYTSATAGRASPAPPGRVRRPAQSRLACASPPPHHRSAICTEPAFALCITKGSTGLTGTSRDGVRSPADAGRGYAQVAPDVHRVRVHGECADVVLQRVLEPPLVGEADAHVGPSAHVVGLEVQRLSVRVQRLRALIAIRLGGPYLKKKETKKSSPSVLTAGGTPP
jgi:hypothetical protein